MLRRLLIVESNYSDLELLKKRLNQNDLQKKFVFSAVTSIASAKACLSSGRSFDLILSSYEIEDGIGFDVFRLIKDTPLILMIPQGHEATAVEALKMGIAEYVIKDKDDQYLNLLPHLIHRTINASEMLQESLRKSEARLQALINSQTNYVIRTDLDGKYTYWNRKFEEDYGWLFGNDPIADNNGLITICSHHHERTLATIEQCILNPGKVFQVELDKNARDGGIWTTYWDFVCLVDSEGNPSEIQCIGIDITQRVRAERLLEATEARHRQIMEMMSDYAYLLEVDENNNLYPLWITDSMHRIIDQPHQDLIDDMFQYTHPDDVKQVKQDWEDTLSGKNTISVFRSRKKDGDYMWVEVTRKPIWDDEKNRVIQILGSGRDITEKRTSAMLLAASEERYRAIVEQQADVICRYDKDLKITFVNQAHLKAFGGTSEYYIGKSLEGLLPSDQRVYLLNNIQQISIENPISRNEHYIRTRDGSMRWYQWIDTALFDDDGQIIEFQGVGRDITEQKLAEQKILANQTLLQRAEAIANLGSWSWTAKTSNLQWSNNMYKLLALPEEITPTTSLLFDHIHPDDKEIVLDTLRESVNTGNAIDITHRMIRHDGAVRVMHELGEIQRSEDGEIIGVIGITHDITEQYETQNTLTITQNRLQQFLDTIDDGVWSYDIPENRLVYTSAAVEEIHGQSVADFITLTPNLDRYVPESDHHKIKQLQQDVSRTGRATSEFRIIHPEKGIRWVYVKCFFIYDNDNNPIRLEGITTDITERKELELRLIRSEARYRAILDAALDAVVSINTRGEIVEFNRAAEQIFGYQQTDVISKPMADYIMPDHLKAAHETGFNNYVKTHKGHVLNQRMELPGKRADDTTFPMELYIVPIDIDDEVIATAFMRDITIRKQAETALRKSEEQYRSLIESSDAEIVMFSPDGDCLYANQIACNIFGIHSNKTTKRNIFEIFPTAMAERRLADIQRVIDTEQGQIKEEISTIHGKESWYRASIQPVRDENGYVYAALVNSIDITERKLVEQALRDSEQRLAEAQTTAHIGSFERNLTTGEVYWSDEVYHLLGINPLTVNHGQSLDEEIESLKHIVHPDDQQLLKQHFDQLFAQNFVQMDIRILLPDDSIRHVHFNLRLLQNKQNQNEFIKGTLQDVTDSKRIEAQLKNLNHTLEERVKERTLQVQRQASAMDLTVEGMSLLIEGKYTYVNMAHANMYGYTPDEILGQSWQLLFDSEEVTWIRENVLPILNEQRTWSGELRALHKDGTQFDIDVSMTYLGTDELIYTCRDITERKLQAQKLEDSQNLLQTVLDTIPAAVYWKDKDLHYAGCNHRFLEYQRLSSADEIIGQTDFDMPWAEQYKGAYHKFDQQILRGELPLFEYQEHRTIPKNQWLQTTKVVLSDLQKRPIGVLAVKVDITQVKTAEEDLKYALEKQRELNKMKSQFVSMTSHEFRTPLASISATCETLRDFHHRMTDEDRIKRFERIAHQIRHMTRMLDDVLLMGRIEDGRQKLHLEEFSLDHYIQGIVDEFSNMKTSHILTYSYDTTPIQIIADQTLLRQICTNLIDNAIKYSPTDSEVHIALTARNEQAVITIEDNGIGIPENDLSRLFEPFQRAENVGAINGTGLGLAITKSAVDMHGGTIRVESVVDKGTMFTIILPLTIQEGI